MPSFLKAYYGMNEIITTLMMAYLGINLANLLIKGPFLTDTAFVPQTNVIPFDYLLPYIPGHAHPRRHHHRAGRAGHRALHADADRVRPASAHPREPTPRPPCMPAST